MKLMCDFNGFYEDLKVDVRIQWLLCVMNQAGSYTEYPKYLEQCKEIHLGSNNIYEI
jgi:hypothetical protein